MPYLRRLVLLLTLSTSILLVTIHLLHISRPRHTEPLHPVVSKEEAEKSFNYLKQYEHPKPPPMAIPKPEYAANVAYGNEKPKAPTKDDVFVPPPQDDASKKLYGNLPQSKIAPPNATAWHRDKNLWKVADALHG